MQSKELVKICAQSAGALPGSARYYSLLFLEQNKRNTLIALYAFQQEVMKIALQCRDPHVALAKLNWWRNEINLAFNHAASHPITQTLQPNLGSLHQQRLQNVLNTLESDLGIENYRTQAELNEFLYRCGGEIEVIAAYILGCTHAETMNYARQLGMGLQRVNNLLQLREHLRSGLVYLSEETLCTYNISHIDLAQAKLTDALQALLAEQIDLAEQAFSQAEQSLKPVDRQAQHPGLIRLRLEQALIALIKTANYAILTQRISLTPMRMLGIAVKTHLTG